MRTRTGMYVACLCALVASALGGLPRCAPGQETNDRGDPWPRSVLITNDDGVDDPGLQALARAFAMIAETWVVAPMEDRSGSTHYVSAYSKHVFQVEERDLGPGIRAYGVDGYPGDCVLLALQGLMDGHPPDLVISGINGGPNLGFDWLASGTIGAARLATVWGVPAIAVSGLDTSLPEAAPIVAEWVARLAQTGVVRGLRPGQYLTVSFPRRSPSEFKGVRVAERAGILLDFRFIAVEEETSGGRSATWALQRPQPIPPTAEASDAALYELGYVVIVPMQADEHDRELLSRLVNAPDLLPGWPVAKAEE